MEQNKTISYIKEIVANMPIDWLNITTHRLDIYDEKLAKTQFVNEFEALFQTNNSSTEAFNRLPTAYDYIRLGHPLSCVLEWAIAKLNHTNPENVISFSSVSVPVLAILRTNLLAKKKTQILYTGVLPSFINVEVFTNIYGYSFELKQILPGAEVQAFDGTSIFLSQDNDLFSFETKSTIDFYIRVHESFGSVLLVNGEKNKSYVPDIQHVRRRETIAMTPINCLEALKSLVGQTTSIPSKTAVEANKQSVLASIQDITNAPTTPLVGSSGLSIQYAIMMGLIHHAEENHKGKAIKFVVPPNCYGGTNDQARRVAACLSNVEIMDLPVDGGNDMVQSVEVVLEKIAAQDAIAYIIAEIPTNPRVEVPNLEALRNALSKVRYTAKGDKAIDPVFILDQTFCPNVHFLGDTDFLSTVRTISYASGSKFPSGGKCTAGYCVGNKQTSDLMDKIAFHLALCDNEATDVQYEILASQLPSMNQRIEDAYKNTRDFVNFIRETLPAAKINFVSEELANQGFMPSVFSLDLPTKGATEEEKEAHKRALNLQLIHLMITKIPHESKFCVSYGQLKGCYWTIPATSTQGTTKEGDKDYIVRAALSANMDMDLHKKVFVEFVNSME